MEDEEIKLKEPKTFEEQLHILEDRHMKIDNKEEAAEVLRVANYYRLTAYALQFKKNDDYCNRISFNNMYKLYKFDKKLRHLILEILESIEVKLRTYMAYRLSIEYGAEAYKNPELFQDMNIYYGYDDDFGKHHKGLIEEINLEVYKNRKELFIKHHLKNYQERFPLWVIVEIFSFGMLSKMYSNLTSKQQKKISKGCFNANNGLLESWLNNLAYVRNICAHYGRLYNKKMVITPRIHNKYNSYELETNRLFVSILAIKELTIDMIEWRNFETELKALIEEYMDVIDLKLIGFPENWIEILSKN